MLQNDVKSALRDLQDKDKLMLLDQLCCFVKNLIRKNPNGKNLVKGKIVQHVCKIHQCFDHN
ncbi:hypothetical protein HanXRQr2_Chr13g0578881 [Helianthus annuus]|uniref:Uncharacterized protein n=1 Tax=Helianthus annuus TaxID=4232 RepID=A0A251STD5_HELAN|nr:hypothetical protein HanXRQr2_Chr13g0578881 [Helianthus annuus]KAJ0848412.1 hypothetical protein HanPSC8_Chr13g0556991 [Helianthus annuus]